MIRNDWCALRALGRAAMIVVLPYAAGCAARTAGTERFPQLAEHAGLEITEVSFVGGQPFGRDTLQSLVQTRPSRCSLIGIPVCIPFTSLGRREERVSPNVVARDVDRLALFYRSEGYFGTAVEPAIDEAGDGVRVTFRIDRADPVLLDSMVIQGTEGVMDPDSLAATLPLTPGEIFNLSEFAASADTVLRALHARGHAHADVLRNFAVDATTDRATVHLEVLPGPVVRVDSIALLGVENLGRRTTLRQLTFREGDLLRHSALVESQRNLYGLELVQFASVSLAPDSLQSVPEDRSRATVVVRIAEAPVHQIDAGLGWGTVECFRSDVRWESRSFGGAARRLVLSGSASKIGIGTGLSSICRAYSAFASDTFANALDYRVAADLTQPYFISPRNNLALNLFGERISEPNVFQRQAAGGRLTLTRRVSPRTFLSSSVDLERGRTIATDALFCGAFQVCDRETIERLSATRFRNTVNLNLLRERRDQPLDPTTGYVARTGLTWAPSWLLSDVTFVRWTGDVSVYRGLGPGWVSAGSLRFGNFFQTALPGSVRDFLPPEDRLFAGGATTVRGFDRNGLGPGIWVTDRVEIDEESGEVLTDSAGVKVPVRQAAQFVPSGGTSLLVLNAELRTPSPFMRDVLRLAFFVDAGSVTTRHLWDVSAEELKVTPGIGFRFQTPVGPVRMDVAYNPHGKRTAPLFLSDPQTGELIRIEDAFRPEPGGLLSRLRIHVAVGQAF